jgi:hypothetical protein
MKSNMKYLNYILIFLLFYYYGYNSYAQSDSIVSVSGEVGGFNSSLDFLNESGGTTRFPRLTDAGERLYYEPVVSTDSVPAATVGASTAIVYGNILFNGWYETVLEQGFQISTTDDFSSTITYQVIPGAPYVNCNPPCAENVFSYFFTGLTAATTYFVRAYAINDKGVGYGNVLSFLTPTLPTVTTNTVSNIVATTATCGGNVTSDGGATVTARGVCWSTSHNPTISNSKTSNGTGTGSFTSSITGLTANTTYYVRAYATNSVGTAYGAEKSFTTPTLPTVTTNAVGDIACTTATCGGNVTSNGGATVTARGVCWSTSQNPTISNSKTINGTGTGSFTSSITGLTAGTTYYVRAYATTSAGTSYGPQRSFTTTAASLPTVTTKSISSWTQTSVTTGGNVTSDGCATVTERGVCWSTTTRYPTISNSHKVVGSGTGSFTCTVSTPDPEKRYYIRAYAKNSEGVTYGSYVSWGN